MLLRVLWANAGDVACGDLPGGAVCAVKMHLQAQVWYKNQPSKGVSP